MKLQHLEYLATLLATRDHQPQVRYVAKPIAGLRAGYYLDDTFIGNNREEAFTLLVNQVSRRLAWVDPDYPASKIGTRRGRGEGKPESAE